MDTVSIIQLGLNFFELLACVTGFVYWRKINKSYWKWFPVYLGVIVMIELTGKLLMNVYDDREANLALYNYFGIPIQFLFFFWLFYRFFKTEKLRRWPIAGLAIYLACWMAERFFLTVTRTWFMSFSYTVGNIILLVLIILFFIKFINSDEILKYKQSMMFWVSLGLLAFYLGTFPYYALRNTLFDNYKQLANVYFYISFGLDYLMYILFTIAFIWGRPK